MKNNLMITPEGMRRLLLDDDYKRGNFHQALLNVAYEDWQEHDNALIYQSYIRIDRDNRDVKFEGTKAQLDEWWKDQTDELKQQLTGGPKKGEESWGYGEMLDNAREKYGELFYIATLVGKYNQQVGNGGHIQYFDNGYASEGGGFGSDHDPSIPLHREMVKQFESQIVPLLERDDDKSVAYEALSIMKQFKIQLDRDKTNTVTCDVCGGSGEVDGEEEDSTETCDNCGGSGDVEEDNDDYNTPINKDELDRLDSRWYDVDDKFEELINNVVFRIALQLDPTADEVVLASITFKLELNKCKEDFSYVMPSSEMFGDCQRSIECYELLIADNVRYNYLEKIVIEEEGINGYWFDRTTLARTELNKMLQDMKPGDSIDYWTVIADQFDLTDHATGGVRQDIVTAYDTVLDNWVGYGKLEPIIVNDNGNDITTGYRRTAKK